MLGLINGQALEMAALIEDLLVASRAEMDRPAVVDAVFPVEDELVATVSSLARYSGSKPVTLDLEPGLEVVADPIRLRQVVRNLLTNAFRYGGGTVAVRTRRKEHTVQIMVCDTGAPISDTDIERVFRPYERLHSGVAGPSPVGLGLAVSRTLARLMGGSLSYHHDGAESVFTLTLADPALEPVS